MTMYGVAIIPLIAMFENQNLTKKWYADNGNVAGSLETLRIKLSKLNEHGGAFGYNVTQCHLITIPEFVPRANKFLGLDVEDNEGHRALGSVVWFRKKLQLFDEKKVNELL